MMGEHHADAVQGLTCRQAQALDLIAAYHAVTGEPCPIRYLARRMSVHASTATDYVHVLHRKGWLRASGPAVPARDVPHPRQFAR